MLTFLSIRNLALVDQLLWEPQSGFICITGETGAGKSVIINAISLALGERADKSLIRTGEENCTIEAIFSIPADSMVHHILDDRGMPPCEDGSLMIRRIISPSVNRQFINDCPCTLNLLKETGALLVDMHGPNDHRSLVSKERQLALVDSFGEHHSVLSAYAGAWKKWQETLLEYDRLMHSEATSERELDLLKHQVFEIEEAGFDADEAATLEGRWQKAKNSTKLLEAASKMRLILEGDHETSLLSLFRELSKTSQELVRLDSATEPWVSPVHSLEVELGELETALFHYLNSFDSNPSELAILEERINLLEDLKQKYGPRFEDIMDYYHDGLARLDQVENRSEKLTELEQTLSICKKEVDRLGAELSGLRRMAAPKLSDTIVKHSRELGFKKALFEIKITERENASAYGFEEVEFLFGPNIGEPSKPLRLIASSGELSRVMLAIKSAIADKDDTPLLVFDEIDANVGGEVARAVGRKMQELGIKHQIISITHFPQVAAMAKHHYIVEKALLKNRSISRLREVSGHERIDELVRMLGGGGAEAYAHAKALLS